jgi:uncharacterized protein YchJ
VDRLREIDVKIQRGYEYLSEDNCTDACDVWLEAWEGIKGLFASGFAGDIADLDKKHKWTEFIFNYAQDLEAELHNAGLEDAAYHGKRIEYCRELLQYCDNSEHLMISNTRRAIAEACFESGDEAGGDRLFAQLIDDDPDCGFSYVARASCHQFKASGRDNGKAEEILLSAYSRSGLRDKDAVVDNLIALYQDMHNPEKEKEFTKILSDLRRTESKPGSFQNPMPVKVVKTGRNEPCPCGSGKKYKKCCGA